MRILYINTEENVGGAGIACDRLRLAMRQVGGVTDLSLVHNASTASDAVVPVNSLVSPALRGAEKAIKYSMMGTGYQYRLMPFTQAAILSRAREFAPDVINLHNLHAGMEGYFPIGLLEALSRVAPLLWTFHDMWPLTGHCAYDMDCGRWRNGCGECPRLNEYPAILLDRSAQNLAHKTRIFQGADITVVTPSGWLADLTRQSPAFSGKRVETINNGIDIALYTRGDKQQARSALGLESKGPVLMFVAKTAAGNKRKGANELLEIVDKLSARMNRPVTLMTVGHGEAMSSPNPNVRIFPLGYVDDEQKMALAYQAADIFLFPTRADNLPNALVEAVCCGTPCATFDIGGCGEIIQDNVNGILVPPFDADEMVRRLIRFFDSGEEQARLSATAFQLGHQRYHWHEMAGKYLALMQEISRPGKGATRP